MKKYPVEIREGVVSRIHRNPKAALHIMEKYRLLSKIRRHRKWVNMGQQVHKYKNLLGRQFHADRPNSKWRTDSSYILERFILVMWPFRLQGRRRKAWGSDKTSLTCQCAVAGRRHADQTLKGTVKIVAVGDADQAGNVPGAGIGGLQ